LLTKQASRGTIYLNTSDIYAGPLLDYRTFTNPIDIDVTIESFRLIRRWYESTTMEETFAPVEIKPGADVTSDEALSQVAQDSSSASAAHIVRTSR
jgi:choline dehydrogenase-like flavoprotein